MSAAYDLAIIGGGINGCGIARDAAGRGLRVLLCEKADLGGATSSASTKLIHGGLRYLEHYEFDLVRHALEERERLWRIAPHIIWPLRFVLPHRRGLRPAWMLRLGLLVYDHLGGRKLLPATRTLHLSNDPAGAPLRNASARAFEYSDCWVQDNRLVVLNARDAAARGSDLRVRTACRGARRTRAGWQIDLEDLSTRSQSTITARVVINAAGPWIEEVRQLLGDTDDPSRTRLVQGSHIVVRRLYDHDRCYIFQHEDGRIIFAIPYEGEFTLIGTTDRDFSGDPGEVQATDGEICYLCNVASSYFRASISSQDVVWSYSGVRPLYDDGASAAQEATRDYVLRLAPAGQAPLLNIYGGKITTYRRLAEDALAALFGALPEARRNAGWTASAPLPGGDFPANEAAVLAAELRRKHPFLDERQAIRLVRHYGTESWQVLGRSRSVGDLGRAFGGDLTEAEVEHLLSYEFVRCADDIVWRRTKSGLRMTESEIGALDGWIRRRTGTADHLVGAARR